jgi:STE24 endopeptidase
MQLFPILLVVVLAARDGGMGLTALQERWGAWPALIALALPMASGLLMIGVRVALGRRAMDRGGGLRHALAAERAVRLLPWLALVGYAVAVLACGWLDLVRTWTGDVVLLDELVAISPALAAPLLSWWLFYPIERRFREAVVFRRLDSGLPVYAVPSRFRYVVTQTRLQLLLTLVPIVLLLTWSEGVRSVAAAWSLSPSWRIDVASMIGSLTIFACAPAIARWTLDVTPMAPGPTRDDLMNVCRSHNVGIRDLLVWHTDGAMINGAVMGLLAPLRYVMLTDALLDSLTRPQLLAVMAHEVGHVRRRHLWWMAASIAAIAVMTEVVGQLVLWAVDFTLHPPDLFWIWIEGAASIGAMTVMFFAFGWISRRFERQADTFAVQHLSRHGQASPLITPESVDAMTSALDAVSSLNSIDPDRRSWRHGSIRWRRRYLRDLVGQSIERLAIDRLVVGIKLTAILTLLIGAGLLMTPWVIGTIIQSSSHAAANGHETLP